MNNFEANPPQLPPPSCAMYTSVLIITIKYNVPPNEIIKLIYLFKKKSVFGHAQSFAV